ncbi:MAG: Ig-like domain-containing protein [Myxococcota bacterium]
MPLASCGVEDAAAPAPALGIRVAPLSLPGITDACFGVTVYDGTETGASIVWQQTGLCSSQYGNGGGGDIAYIGTCSAQPDGAVNAIDLVLEGLYQSGVAPGGAELADGWQNPCPAGKPCRLTTPCRQNADSAVTFNLTVMRDANQGFFDIAVNFADVFCSAKLDCVDELLHDGDARGDTAVVAFACTSGGDTTHLYMDDIVVRCGGDQVFAIDPSQGPGQLGARTGSFESAVYAGAEDFPDFEKCYWNVAVGLTLGELPGDCTLTARGTASENALAAVSGGFTTPADTVYPIVEWSVPLTHDGVMICGSNPLNGEGSGVTTAYTDFAGEPVAHHRACGAGSEPPPPGNTPPFVVAGAPDTIDMNEGSTDFEDATKWFADAETKPLTIFAIKKGPSWLFGSGFLFANVPWGADDQSPYTVTVRATDAGGLFVDRTVSLVINSRNRTPFSTGTTTFTFDAALGGGSGSVASYFADPDGDAMTFTAGAPSPYVSVASDGTLTFTFGNGDVGVHTFEVIAWDGQGGFGQSFTLEITGAPPANHPPRQTDASPKVISENAFDAVSFADVFTDDDGDPLSYTVELGADMGFASAGADSVSFEPGFGDGRDLPYEYVVHVSDGVDILTTTLQVYVTNVNRAPVASDETLWVREGETMVYDASHMFYDDDGDPLTVLPRTDFDWVSFDAQNAIHLAPGFDVQGDQYYTVDVSDGIDFTTIDIHILVENVNQAPTSSPFTFDVNEGDVYAFDVSPYFSDPDGDPIVSYDWQPNGGELYASAMDGSVLVGQPGHETISYDGGDRTVRFTARGYDPDGLRAEQEFTVNIHDVPQGPGGN